MFYCDKPADKGGETPICLSNLIYEQISREFPDFIEEIGKKVLFLFDRYVEHAKTTQKKKKKRRFRPSFLTYQQCDLL
jgi:Taurine catabolism dioxygenase TauD, TfdA family